MIYRLSETEQGSDEWLQERSQYITGSIFHALLTKPVTKAAREAGELSETAKGVLCTIVAAYDGGIKENISTPRLTQSHIDEDEAAADYELQYDVDLEHTQSFLISTKYRFAAISPDGIRKDNGEGVEIKCLNPDVHTRVLLEENGKGIDKKYMAQMEWYCFVLGIDSCNYYGYCGHLDKMRRYTWKYTMTDERRDEIEDIYYQFEAKIIEALESQGIKY